MAQLTLRTLLAYIDDTLEPEMARELGVQVAASPFAKELIERIKVSTRRRGLKTPAPGGADDDVSDPNTVAEYLSDTLDAEHVRDLEQTCLESDAHLAEVAACHQILSLVLTEPVRVPPRAHRRMYALVSPPASNPKRRPRPTRAVGGVAPRADAAAEPDDADAALLLGLGRYSGDTPGTRLVLAGVVAVSAVLLAVAVYNALPGRGPAPPDSSPGGVYAAAPPEPEPPAEPDPGKKDDPTPKTDDTPAEKREEAPPPRPAEKVAGGTPTDKAADPRPERMAVGRVQTPNVIVLARADAGPAWLRLDPGGEATVSSADTVLALPGYKADVKLDSGVVVHLWGNVPDQLPNGRLLESRVRFHAPAAKAAGKGDASDADLTVEAGRVYLSTTGPAARVRVRFAGEVWDVALPTPEASVMVEVLTGFDPGAAFARAGGPAPRTEARLAVVRGTAGLAAPDRSRRFDPVTAPAVVTWDSGSGAVADPRPVDKGDAYFDKLPVVPAAQGVAVGRALTDLAGRLTAGGRIGPAVAEPLNAPPAADAAAALSAQLAVYAQAAIVFGDGAADELKPLIDRLADEGRGYARLAAVNALAGWVARAPGNSALLEKAIADKLGGDGGVPEIVVRLLRGQVNPADPDPKELDRLVGYLSHRSVAVRELALWNLVNFADPSAADPARGLTLDVGAANPAQYKKFVEAWTARVEEVKKRPAGKK